MEFYANEGKNISIDTGFGRFDRHAIHTHFVNIGEDFLGLIEKYVLPVYQSGDIVSVSEKIVSLCQKRVVYKNEMKLTPLARFLSHFASHSTAGIGVDCPWKMQFAIDCCGTAKVLYAAIISAAGKLFGKKGMFYKITGPEVWGLDGFYDREFKEYGDYGIRIPEDPEKVCNDVYEQTGIKMMIVDANDITRCLLGKAGAISYSEEQLMELIDDNPAGQSRQLTPFIIIRKCSKNQM